ALPLHRRAPFPIRVRRAGPRAAQSVRAGRAPAQRHHGAGGAAQQRADVLRASQPGAQRPRRAAPGGQRRVGAGDGRGARVRALRGAHGLQRHPPLLAAPDRGLHGARGDALRARRERVHLVRRDRVHAHHPHGQRAAAGHGAGHPGRLGLGDLLRHGGGAAGEGRDRGGVASGARGGAAAAGPAPGSPLRPLALRHAPPHRHAGKRAAGARRGAARLLPPLVPPGADGRDRRGRLRPREDGGDDRGALRPHPRGRHLRAAALLVSGDPPGRHPLLHRRRPGGHLLHRDGGAHGPGARPAHGARVPAVHHRHAVRRRAQRPPQRGHPASRRALPGRLLRERVAGADAGRLLPHGALPRGGHGAGAGRAARRGGAGRALRLHSGRAGARKGRAAAVVGADPPRAGDDHLRAVRGAVRGALPVRRSAAHRGDGVPAAAGPAPGDPLLGGERARAGVAGGAQPLHPGEHPRARRRRPAGQRPPGRRHRFRGARPPGPLHRDGLHRAPPPQSAGWRAGGVGAAHRGGGRHGVGALQRRAGSDEAHPVPPGRDRAGRTQPRRLVAAGRCRLPARRHGRGGGAGGRRGDPHGGRAGEAPGGENGKRGRGDRRAERVRLRLRRPARRGNDVPARLPLLHGAPPRPGGVGSVPGAGPRGVPRPLRQPGGGVRGHAAGGAHAGAPARPPPDRRRRRFAGPGPRSGRVPRPLQRRGRLHLLHGGRLPAGLAAPPRGALPGRPSRRRPPRDAAGPRRAPAGRRGAQVGAARGGAAGAHPGGVQRAGGVGAAQRGPPPHPGGRAADPPARAAARGAVGNVRRGRGRLRPARAAPRVPLRGGLQRRPRPPGRALQGPLRRAGGREARRRHRGRPGEGARAAAPRARDPAPRERLLDEPARAVRPLRLGPGRHPRPPALPDLHPRRPAGRRACLPGHQPLRAGVALPREQI
ncbi:MAG: Probable zinc protease pqqL, partial [uncultured Gemmatimonadetes bacterium]